jgi:hypothetical protein
MDEEQSPTFIMCESAEEAAYSQINQYLEMTGGEMTDGVVRVWASEEDVSQARVFGWEAEIAMPEQQPDDLEEDEVELEAEITLDERV